MTANSAIHPAGGRLSTAGFMLTVLLLTFCFQSSMAQELKQFTLEDLNFGGTNYRNMVPQNKWYGWWGDELVRLDVESCHLINKQTGRETPLFTLAELNKANGAADFHALYNASFPYPDKPLALVENGRKRVLYNFRSRCCRRHA